MIDFYNITVLASQAWAGPSGFFLVVTIGLWLACRFLNRHLRQLRHLPWMLALLMGFVGFYLAITSKSTGSSMGAAFESTVWFVLGLMAAAVGLVSMTLFLLFPGNSPRHECQETSDTSPHDPDTVAVPGDTTSYAVLLDSLEQMPTREQYAKAAGGVPGVTAADMGGTNERLGILIQQVDANTAQLFHTALAQFHIPTRVFAASEMFPMPMGRRVRALRLEGDTLWETDMVGREYPYRLDQLLRCCGGRIEDLVRKTRTQIKTRAVRSMGKHIRMEPYEVKTQTRVTSASLRCEWFIRQQPYRLIWACDRETRLHLNGEPVGPDNPAPFEAFLRELRTRVPAEKTNIGIRSLNPGEAWVYPSVASFEMETIWALTRALSAQGELP